MSDGLGLFTSLLPFCHWSLRSKYGGAGTDQSDLMLDLSGQVSRLAGPYVSLLHCRLYGEGA